MFFPQDCLNYPSHASLFPESRTTGQFGMCLHLSDFCTAICCQLESQSTLCGLQQCREGLAAVRLEWTDPGITFQLCLANSVMLDTLPESSKHLFPYLQNRDNSNLPTKGVENIKEIKNKN